jgi:hypothetical protein
MLEHANGEHSEDADREPWSLWDAEDEITMGMLWEEHDCDNPEERFRSGEGCDCETRDFDWSSCDGCGSTLGGERFAFTAWTETQQ